MDQDPSPIDPLDAITETVLQLVLIRITLRARLAAEADLQHLEQSAQQDLAPVRAQLEHLFSSLPLPAFPAPALHCRPQPPAGPATVSQPPKPRGRPPKDRSSEGPTNGTDQD